MILANLFATFLLGLATPLTAVCVLPLYPGFLAYLSNQITESSSKRLPFYLGLMVTAGVVVFMVLLGIIFTTLLQISLTSVVEIISPIAFGILGIVSIALIFNFDFARIIPKPKTPTSKKPFTSAFVFGFFFGAIVLPCNPALIAAFFARALLQSTGDVVTTILQFVFFGIGMATPLLVFSIISGSASKTIIGFLTKHTRKINLIAGILMLVISVYYLFFVFKII